MKTILIRVAAGVCALVFFQQLFAWPLRSHLTLQLGREAEVQELELSEKRGPHPWNYTLVHTWQGGEELPRFGSRELLQESGQPGFYLQGGGIVVRPRAVEARECVLTFPWSMQSKNALRLLVFFALLTPWLRIRLKWLPWAVALGVVAGGVALRFGGLSYPHWKNDTISYFKFIYNWIEFGRLQATPDRPFGYTVFMGWLLQWRPSFQAVVTAQSLASLVAGLALGAVVWRAGDRLFPGSAWRTATRLLAVLAAAGLLLNESVAEREWALLSEGWVSVYLGLQMATGWILLTRVRRLGPGLAWFGVFAAAGLLALFTRPNWGFAIAWIPLPWLVFAWRRMAWLGAGALVFLVEALLAFGFQAHVASGDTSVYFYDRARALVCFHVPLVRLEIDRLLALRPDPVVAEMKQVLDAELYADHSVRQGSYPSLKYDPDILYEHQLQEAPLFSALTIPERTALCSSLFKDALKRHPGIYLRKVALQMRRFFLIPYERPRAAAKEVVVGLRQSFGMLENGQVLPRFVPAYRSSLERAQAQVAHWPSGVRGALAARMRSLFEVMIASFLAMLVLPMLALGAACAFRVRLDAKALVPVVTLAVWALGSSSFSALSSAATQGLDIQRYIQLSIPTTLLAQFLWLFIGLHVLAQRAGVQKGAADGPGPRQSEVLAERGPEVGQA